MKFRKFVIRIQLIHGAEYFSGHNTLPHACFHGETKYTAIVQTAVS